MPKGVEHFDAGVDLAHPEQGVEFSDAERR